MQQSPALGAAMMSKLKPPTDTQASLSLENSAAFALTHHRTTSLVEGHATDPMCWLYRSGRRPGRSSVEE